MLKTFIAEERGGGKGNMPTQKKAEAIQVIKEKLETAKAVVLTDYRGLNVAQVTDLRKKLRDAGIEYKVLKNTLTGIAAKEVGIDESVENYLQGPTAIAFTYDDPVAAAKILAEFAKGNDKLQIKGGILDKKVISAEGVDALAKLPAREVLIAQVLAGMQAPISGLVNVLQGTIRNFVYVVDAIRKQKEGE